VAPTPVDILVLEERAERQVAGWRIITRQVPATPGREMTFTLDTGDGGQPQKRATLVLDAATAEVIRWEPFSADSPGRQFRSILRFAHTGEVAGLVGQTVAGQASLGAVFLDWTGFWMAGRRFVKWLGRNEPPDPALARSRQRRREMAESA
jgi:uncharacterized iron-regulated membrane protein